MQVTQKAFVNITKSMAVFAGIKVNLVQLVHNLTDNGAIFHVVVGTSKNVSDKNSPLVHSILAR